MVSGRSILGMGTDDDEVGGQHLTANARESEPSPVHAPPTPSGDITFSVTATGYEVRYSERMGRDHAELVDQSADWLEDALGVVNLGQIDHNLLIADGPLTDAVKNGLMSWWADRVADLDLG
jgi:hypothetical protein